ncbi:MAG: L-seryl-tRNA(Sec) selenium transferase [bacterium]
MPKPSKSDNPLSALPSVDAVLGSGLVQVYIEKLSPEFVTYCARESLAELRSQIQNQKRKSSSTGRDELLKNAVRNTVDKIETLLSTSLRRAVNGTGVILHTGLGRAPLPPEALDQITRAVENYCNLELDLQSGKRGERLSHIDELLCFLSGAERSAVVNNNAAAVLIALNTLAREKEVIISRGQLIEIGGSFRLPDVMKQSGAIMREIGTTNKTHFRDYERAVNENTGAILVAHSSNFRILGFTQEAPLEELVKLAHSKNIPLIYDLGGGVFLDLVRFGLPHEPIVPEVVRTGVDVVTFSGDKVLGGPQSGLIVGRKTYVDAIRRNPLMRALRTDKLILAALEAILKMYLNPQPALLKIPVFRMLLEPIADQKSRGEKLLGMVKEHPSSKIRLRLEEGTSQIGSGALPLVEIPSTVLAIESEAYSAERIAQCLRAGDIPVVGYVRDGKNFLNLRTIRDDELEIVAEKIKALCTGS